METNYNIGESYPFKIRNVFNDYCELIDEERGIRAYLKDTANLRLSKGQIINCKILSFKEKHPQVELVDLTDIIVKKNARITEDVMNEYLVAENVKWNTREFMRIMFSDETSIPFARQCRQMIGRQIATGGNLMDIRQDCENILEYSTFLDRCTPGERELYQTRFTTIIENLSYYIKAQRYISNDNDPDAQINAQYYVTGFLDKLRQSGFVYHPRKHFNILSSIFQLSPDLMYAKMPELFDIIRSRDLNRWLQEPFRTGLIKILEQYILDNEGRIDRTKDNADMVAKTIEALAIQLLLINGQQNSDDETYHLASSRICTVTSYARTANALEIITLALNNLLGENIDLPKYNLTVTGKPNFPFFIADTARRSNVGISSVNTYTSNHVCLTVSGEGIALKHITNSKKADPVLPAELNLWQGMQVFLPQRPASSRFIGVKDIFKYKQLWHDIESEMFDMSSQNTANTKNKKKRHKVTDTVNISIVRQDTNDSNKFYCRIEDEIGGEGYIMLSQIVGYTAAISVRHFLSDAGKRLIFEAVIIDNDDDMHVFSMAERLKEWAETFYDDEEDIVCSLGARQTRNSGYLPGVTTEGISVSLGGLENIDGLERNDIVLARFVGRAPGTFHIEARIIDRTVDNFDLEDCFHFLMTQYAVGEVEDMNRDVEDKDIMDADNIMDITTVRELIYIIDRVAIIDNEYIKSYNYLAFARILSLMIGWDSQASYYKGRMDIILMLHDFAVNDRVDENGMNELSTANSDLFSGNPILHDRFKQLQTVSFIGKPEHNTDLWALAADKDETIRELAELVLSYNFVKANNMDSQAVDIHNRIKTTLRLRGHETGLRMYGSGIEDKTTEYKTSIVYVADKNTVKPNHQEQMKEILRVICSFLNTDGGTLYIGVNDSGMGVGLKPDLEYPEFAEDKDKYQRCITDNVVRAWGKLVATYVDVNFDATNEKPVCIVTVRPYPQGVHYAGYWYVRIGSTKRPMTQQEFDIYNADSRTPLPSHQAAQQTAVTPDEANNTAEDIAGNELEQDNTQDSGNGQETGKEPSTHTDYPTTSPVQPQESTLFIPLGNVRKNCLYDNGIDEYRPAIAFLQFPEYNKFCMMTDYNWRDDVTTLAVYDEDRDSHLVIVYADGHIARIPLSEILDFQDSSLYTRYAEQSVVFATIASAEDAVMLVTKEENKQRREMIRIDTLGDIEECKLADYGSRVFNEGIAECVLCADIIPAASVGMFKDLVNPDHRSLGKPTKTMKAEYKAQLAALGIQI